MVLFIAVLAFPMLRGKWLAAPMSDQYASAYAVHEWQAEQWRATGQLPLWYPMIMDGLPYIAPVTHGDVLYPTSFLRWWLSADKVTDLGFVLHYILAGLFMFLFLRRSEEHTSELQSLRHLVCRLLLETNRIVCSSHRSIRRVRI